ncbi:Heterokaryon incompatibility protein (HET) domain containing protein [Rhypophila decipiens]
MKALYLDDRIIFSSTEGEGHSSWTHPDPNVSCNLKEPSSVKQQPEVPKYEALSYAWGSSRDEASALVFDPDSADRDPKCLLIRENLASALRHLRRPDLPRVLWVDAICIDQDNLQERGEQVSRMGDIFAMAARVVVWLGPASETSSLAFSILQNYGGKRSWFHRLWVLQEIQLANTSSIIQCGEDSIPWPVFRSAIELLTSHAFDATAQRFSKAHSASVICLPMVDLPLDALLLDNTSRKCSDDRDRIYGILSMAPPRFRASFVSDYTASVADVYKAAFIHHVHTTGRLTFFLWSTKEENPAGTHGLLGAGFCACSLSGAEMKQVSTRSIQIPGIVVDTVSRIRPLDAIHSFADLRNIRLSLNTRVRHIPGMMSHEYYPTLDQWKDIVLLGKECNDRITSLVLLFYKNLTPTLFETQKGFAGLCMDIPVALGDQVMVLLGCDIPMLLRPDETPACHKVISPCYLHGFMNGEALFGPLKLPWLARAPVDENQMRRVRFCRTAPDGKEEELQMSDDPRLWEIPVPKPWQPLKAVRTRDDPRYFCRFENTETGEVINYDPRLSASSLRERGVPVETIRLV